MNKGLRKMQEFAAFYGCVIVEKPILDNGFRVDWLYATCNGNEEAICRSPYANHVGLSMLKNVLERVSGRTLAQSWTGR